MSYFVEDAGPQLSDAEYNAAVSEGRKAERSRIVAVLTHPACIGRETTALKILEGSEMNADQIVGLLATLPKAGSLMINGERSRDAAGGLVVGGSSRRRSPTNP